MAKTKPGKKKKVVPRGKRLVYSKELAIRASREYMYGKHSSFRKAAAAVGGIPESTVRDYYKILKQTSSDGSQVVVPKLVGRHQTISEEYEQKLADHCLHCADIGCGKTKEYVSVYFLLSLVHGIV